MKITATDRAVDEAVRWAAAIEVVRARTMGTEEEDVLADVDEFTPLRELGLSEREMFLCIASFLSGWLTVFPTNKALRAAWKVEITCAADTKKEQTQLAKALRAAFQSTLRALDTVADLLEENDET